VPEVLVAYISSVIRTQLVASDVILDPSKPEFRSTHLKTISALRLHKLATIHSSSLARYLGTIESATLVTVANKLNQLLGLYGPCAPDFTSDRCKLLQRN